MFSNDYRALGNEALELGYRVQLYEFAYTSKVHILTKNIHVTRKYGNDNALFQFAHELGHCKQFEKRHKKLNGDVELLKKFYSEMKKSKIRTMIDETDAWIKGYALLRKNEINTKGFIRHMAFCLKSHLMKKRIK